MDRGHAGGASGCWRPAGSIERWNCSLQVCWALQLLLFEPGMLMVFLLDSSTLLPNPGYASRNPRCHSFKWRTFHTFYARVNSLHWVFNPMTSSRQSISTNPRILLRSCNAFRLSAEERMPSNRVGFQPLSAKQVKVER